MKRIDDSVYEDFFDKIATCEDIAVCAGDPGIGTAGFANAEAGGQNHLANKTATAGVGNATYGATADGTPDGREMEIAAFVSDAASASGTANHLAFMDATHVLYVGTLESSISVTATDTVSVPAHKITMADPS